LAHGYSRALRGEKWVLSFMSVAELREGAFVAQWGSRRRDVLNEFILDADIVFPDDELCSLWARLRTDVRAIGRTLSVPDAWIAATALSLGLPLATNNRRDFEHIHALRLVNP
jgi:tRNA(fMet)-specific endonuclease VapC